MLRHSAQAVTCASLLLVWALAACGGDSSDDFGVEAAEPDTPLPGQLVIDPENPGRLTAYGGGPALICGPGDPEGFLYRGRRGDDGTRDGDQLALIEKLGATGANSIYMIAVRSHGGDGGPDENPFLNGDPEAGVDPQILSQWAVWLGAMAERGILAYFFFYDDGSRVWKTGGRVGEAEREFITAIVDTLEQLPNIIWVVAEEYSEALSPARVLEIASVIREADDHDHLIAVHQLSGLYFDFADAPSIDQFAAQTRVGAGTQQLHEKIVRAYEEAGGRYSLNIAEVEDHGSGDAATTRRINWSVVMAGGHIMVLRWDIAGTPVEELEQCGYMVDFLEGMELNRMLPRDDLGAGSTTYVLADPGEGYVLYALEAEEPVAVKGLGEGLYDLSWLDVVTGARIDQASVSVPAGTGSWPRPPSIGAELALHLRRSGPGAR